MDNPDDNDDDDNDNDNGHSNLQDALHKLAVKKDTPKYSSFQSKQLMNEPRKCVFAKIIYTDV